MPKNKIAYQCTECGGQSTKWQGQCMHCFGWNTLVESLVENKGVKRYASLAKSNGLTKLDEVETVDILKRETKISEFDRVLGGGFVPGGVILLGGDPGIGKSTILIQALSKITQDPSDLCKVIYISGEESSQQIAMRARRLELEVSDISILSEINLEKIVLTIEKNKPNVVVIDSIQTIYSEEITSAPGSVTQVRECSAQLTRISKQLDITMILVGHVTKEGTLAGPRVLEHIVDTVLYFEGDPSSSFRMIRAFKNRYGAVNELGVFAMTEKGLKEVTNPSALFLSHHHKQVNGSCITCIQEGSRPMLIEIQALVDGSHGQSPKRLSVGLDHNRLAMLLASLNRHAGVACFDQDVFVNAVGGVKIAEPGVDLAILCAIVSSFKAQPLDQKTVIFGEIGLAGEVRPVQRGQERLKEAAKLGFTRAIIPKANQAKQKINGINILPVENLSQALDLIK
ncbi:DNA repair protein RadA [Methylophilaceae bacterium]|jgi:DNA repair protein RadA/Sms|nr:DNA repair protein RadA [Methylophilaceae bacterium]|tara:strand:- start:1480 stop:2844 length:1365 start_codon:yes stop_codon:yes gene_type:complete